MGLARIPWERLEGNDIEAVMAMFVCREHPEVHRIACGRGDGGFDMLALHVAPDTVDVYQVKRHAQRLLKTHKTRIAKSLGDALKTCRDNGWTLRNWYLVIPLDHTLAERQWFDQMLADHEVAGDWLGLERIDNWRSDYPQVVDYYLGDGHSHIDAQVTRLTELLAQLGPVTHVVAGPTDTDADSGSGFGTDAAASAIKLAEQALNDRDPHYRYEVLRAHEPLVDTTDRLYMGAQVTQDPDNGMYTTTRIFARFDAAASFRPIPIRVSFRIAPDSEHHQQFEELRLYGRPLDEPVPATFSVDLPSDLAFDSDTGVVMITPIPAGEPGQCIFDVVNADGTIRASSPITVDPLLRSIDGHGSTIRGHDPAHVFGIEMLGRDADAPDTRTGQVRFWTNPVVGRYPDDVADGLRFIAALNEPGSLVIRPARGPAGPHSQTITIPETTTTDDTPQFLARYVDALAVVQRYVPGGIPIPPDVERSEAASVRFAAHLLDNSPVRFTWTEVTMTLHPGFDENTTDVIDTLTNDDGFTAVQVGLPLIATVGGIDYVVGTYQRHFTRAILQAGSWATTDDGDRRTVVVAAHPDDNTMTATLLGAGNPPASAHSAN